ncbi:MAG: M61 family peptidase [Acidobacteriota bacterium]
MSGLTDRGRKGDTRPLSPLKSHLRSLQRCGSLVVTLTILLAVAGTAGAQPSPVTYAVSFPAPEHHWVEIEATFPDVGTAPLDVRMSRSSPGRYAVHEFAKNVFAFSAYDGQGRALKASRPDADVWRIAAHDGTVRVVYRLFGDFADGTYMAVDTTHAHVNMPATFMWASGQEARPIAVTFTPPDGSRWTAGTQLYPTGDPMRFTAPNLQYFMDSPTELAHLVTSTFEVPNADGRPARFRVMVHSAGTQADVDVLAGRIQRLVREEMAVFGEFPVYETGAYSFLLDFVAWAEPDAMEHRNSTYISSPRVDIRTADGRLEALDMVAHEFFHNWNVERIRPAGLEPFDFTRENVTCCLWLAEGFTEYYGPLLLERAGLINVGVRATLEGLTAAQSPARGVRSAVEISEQAPFADAGIANDVNDRSRTYISYYTLGAGIALGLDLTLRERSHDTLSLDDYMRRLWQKFGRGPDARPGYVSTPYSLKDLRDTLAELTRDPGFASEFFDRYVEGHETIDFAALLATVGLRPPVAREPWIGGDPPVSMEDAALRLGSADPHPGEWLAPFGSPLYAAGLDTGDRVVSLEGEPATLARWQAAIRRAPGTRIALTGARRDGQPFTTTLVVGERVTGGSPSPATTQTDAQRRRLDAWLGTKVP